MPPTPQKTSWVGNTLKSACEHEAPVALGEAAEDTRDIVRVGVSGEWWLGEYCIHSVEEQPTLAMALGIVTLTATMQSVFDWEVSSRRLVVQQKKVDSNDATVKKCPQGQCHGLAHVAR
jgi:hypothetical protein